MPAYAKLLIGLVAALAVGFISHGPLGRGVAFVDRLEADGRAVVARAGVPGVTLAMRRDPLSRTAILAGPANDLQREGLGSYPGLNEQVLAVPGMGHVEWANPPPPSS